MRCVFDFPHDFLMLNVLRVQGLIYGVHFDLLQLSCVCSYYLIFLLFFCVLDYIYAVYVTGMIMLIKTKVKIFKK